MNGDTHIQTYTHSSLCRRIVTSVYRIYNQTTAAYVVTRVQNHCTKLATMVKSMFAMKRHYVRSTSATADALLRMNPAAILRPAARASTPYAVRFPGNTRTLVLCLIARFTTKTDVLSRNGCQRGRTVRGKKNSPWMLSYATCSLFPAVLLYKFFSVAWCTGTTTVCQ